MTVPMARAIALMKAAGAIYVKCGRDGNSHKARNIALATDRAAVRSHDGTVSDVCHGWLRHA